MRIRIIAVIAAAMCPLLTINSSAQAAEGGAGIYLLGLKATGMPGFIPPPGTYVQSDTYYYSGSAGKDLSLPLGRSLALGVDAKALVNATTLTWVAPEKIFGGNFGVGASVVGGWKDIHATAVLGPFSRGISDDKTAFGDPLVNAFLGWHSGNWHWNITSFVNIPVGEYDPQRIANIGFNRWAFDTTGAITYLDPKLGHELSLAAGFTFNGENPATNYKTGTEFHLEWAAIQNLSKQLKIGAVGYYYDQLTGDSGQGAKLGPFEGRVVAVGGMVGYTFQFGQLPVITSLRYFKEFNPKNRLEGDAGFFTVSMPLAVTGR